jgi:hypothetical protein
MPTDEQVIAGLTSDTNNFIAIAESWKAAHPVKTIALDQTKLDNVVATQAAAAVALADLKNSIKVA